MVEKVEVDGLLFGIGTGQKDFVGELLGPKYFILDLFKPINTLFTLEL